MLHIQANRNMVISLNQKLIANKKRVVNTEAFVLKMILSESP